MRTYAVTHSVDLKRHIKEKQMGRPLRKDILGTDVIGTPVDNTGITVAFHDGSTVQNDGIIIKQRGTKTFVVARRATPLVRFTRVLVDGEPAAGQMRMQGSTVGTLDTGLVSIRKITKRVATDFSGNKYTWKLENDSSSDYLVLTPIV
jgi:hypothetical protein